MTMIIISILLKEYDRVLINWKYFNCFQTVWQTVKIILEDLSYWKTNYRQASKTNLKVSKTVLAIKERL